MPLLAETLRRLPPNERIAELKQRIEELASGGPAAPPEARRAALVEALRTRRPQERRQ